VYLYFPVPLQGVLGTDGKHWMRDTLFLGTGYGTAYKVPPAAISGLDNPQDLLAVLKSLSTVRKDGPASGPGWKGTKYSFSAPFNDFITGTVQGTADVDQHGRVRQITLTMVLDAASVSFTGIKNIAYDLTFSDFNASVSVTAPPAKQVYAAAGYQFTYPVGFFQCAKPCAP
jgi:hypothetical protein